jgi:hypothetical protein
MQGIAFSTNEPKCKILTVDGLLSMKATLLLLAAFALLGAGELNRKPFLWRSRDVEL